MSFLMAFSSSPELDEADFFLTGWEVEGAAVVTVDGVLTDVEIDSETVVSATEASWEWEKRLGFGRVSFCEVDGWGAVTLVSLSNSVVEATSGGTVGAVAAVETTDDRGSNGLASGESDEDERSLLSGDGVLTVIAGFSYLVTKSRTPFSPPLLVSDVLVSSATIVVADSVSVGAWGVVWLPFMSTIVACLLLNAEFTSPGLLT